MKNYLYSVFAFCLIAISVSCQKASDLPSINLEGAFAKKHEIKISTIADKIEYIPLETTPECILGDYRYLEVTTKFIIYRCQHQLLLFDRITGKFIREIGKSGRGPDEYDMPPTNHFYNSESQRLYAYGTAWKELLTYDLNGKMIEKFTLPFWNEPTARNGMLKANFGTYIDDKTFAFHVTNEFGLANDNLILYSKDGVIKKFPNYQKIKNKYDNKQRGDVSPVRDEYIRWDGKVFYKDILNDTLFEITRNELIPRLIFNAGKYKFPNGLQYEIYADREYKKFDDYIFVSKMFENDRYLFFRIYYQVLIYTGIYDKKLKKTEICNTENGTHTGFDDDLNGFIPIVPLNITPNNEMLSAFDGLSIKKWIEEHPEKAKTLEKKMPWIKNFSELSNPVVVIAKLK